MQIQAYIFYLCNQALCLSNVPNQFVQPGQCYSEYESACQFQTEVGAGHSICFLCKFQINTQALFSQCIQGQNNIIIAGVV